MISVNSNSSPNSPFSNGYSMMSPYLPPNASNYLDASSDGVCGSIVGLNGGIGPPGSHHSNPPPPPHMVSNTCLEIKTKKCNYFQNAIFFFISPLFNQQFTSLCYKLIGNWILKQSRDFYTSYITIDLTYTPYCLKRPPKYK